MLAAIQAGRVGYAHPSSASVCQELPRSKRQDNFKSSQIALDCLFREGGTVDLCSPCKAVEHSTRRCGRLQTRLGELAILHLRVLGQLWGWREGAPRTCIISMGYARARIPLPPPLLCRKPIVIGGFALVGLHVAPFLVPKLKSDYSICPAISLGDDQRPRRGSNSPDRVVDHDGTR